MGIDPTNAAPHQPTPADQFHNLAVRQGAHQGESGKMLENLLSFPQVAAGKLSDHELVTRNLRRLQQLRQLQIPSAQMIDPHRSVCQNHC